MYYYFTASTKRKKEEKSNYSYILDCLNKLGAKGLNYVHFPKNNPDRIQVEEQIKKGKTTSFDVQTSLIDKSDFLVAYLEKETVTIGYQIDFAIRKKIPVLALIPEEDRSQTPVVLTDDHTELLTVQYFSSLAEASEILKNFVNNLESGRIKFNFFINIPINNYLNQRSEKEKRSKSGIIREIILDEMSKNPV